MITAETVLTDLQRQNPRDASSSWRGYCWQLTLACISWATLGEESVLVLEGDEDFQVWTSDDEKLTHVTGFQAKSSPGKRVSARSYAVYSSLFNFILQYHQMTSRGLHPIFVYISDAEVAAQTSGAEGIVDIINEWTEANDDDLRKSVSEIISKYSDAWARKNLSKIDSIKKRTDNLKGTYAKISASNVLFREFRDSVRWTFQTPELNDLRGRLWATLTDDKRCPGSTDTLAVVRRALDEVIMCTCKSDISERVLTRSQFTDLLIEEEARQLVSNAQKSDPGRITANPTWVIGVNSGAIFISATNQKALFVDIDKHRNFLARTRQPRLCPPSSYGEIGEGMVDWMSRELHFRAYVKTGSKGPDPRAPDPHQAHSSSQWFSDKSKYAIEHNAPCEIEAIAISMFMIIDRRIAGQDDRGLYDRIRRLVAVIITEDGHKYTEPDRPLP